MRCTSGILLLFALAASGCSSLIARSGYYPGELKTVQEVHDKFGEAIAGGTHDGYSYEEFHTHLKIADWMRGVQLGMGFAYTFGLFEIVMFPSELCRTGANTILGQDIRFAYDSAGTVTYFYLDGEWRDRRSSEYVAPEQRRPEVEAGPSSPDSTRR
jgi:hypothetical protein